MAIDIIETWANTGDITIIPDDTQPDGSVSFKQGWGNDYQLDPATVANAKKLSRSNFNYLFSLLTTNQQEQLLYGFNNHIVGKNYPIMARVRGADGLIYESTVETSATPPSADWIEFGGATDEFALLNGDENETFKVADAIEDNQAVNLAQLKENSIGINQTWQDVKSQRTLGVTYTNDTGKPIQVIVGASPSIGSLNLHLYASINGSAPFGIGLSSDSGNFTSVSGYIIVNNGETYNITSSVNSAIVFWNEKRS